MKKQFPGPNTSQAQGYGTQDIFWNGAFCAFEAQVDLRAISINKSWSFPAFITSFRDGYSPNFESVNVFGRIDPIYTFTHTTRKVEIGMDVVSHDASEAKQNWIELNEMAQGLYATYRKKGSEDVISSPPIYGLRFHNLVREINTGGVMQDFVYGVLTSGITLEPDVQEGYFYGGNLVQEHWDLKDPELALQYRVLKENYAGLFIYPKSFKLNLALEVIHTQFRGNRGFLSSPGGPAVSMLREQLPDPSISRTTYDERRTASQNEAKQAYQDKANAAFSKGSK
jgi:hypothetical protein